LTLNWKKTANLLVGDVDLEEGQLLNTEWFPLWWWLLQD
jgi:hypothetical protein